MVVLALLLACQEPFDADRHDLRGDRIAALSVAASDGEVRPRAALWVAGRGWSDDPVDLRWACLPDAGAAIAWDAADPAATGPAPAVACGSGVLALHATFPDGAVERAIADVPGEGEVPELGTLTRAVVDLAISGLAGPELTPDAREPVPATPGVVVPEGGFGRFTVDIPEGATARFMATGGTFFERDMGSADWAAGEIVLDDDEIDVAEAAPSGVVTMLVLAVTPEGRNPFRGAEIPIGEPAPGVWLGERWMAADDPFTGLRLATLAADDDAPTGLRIAASSAFDGIAWPDVPCLPPETPLDPDVLVDGTCLRSDLAGATVVIDAADHPQGTP